MRRAIAALFIVLCLVPFDESGSHAADMFVVTLDPALPWACAYSAPFQLIDVYVAIYMPSRPVTAVSFEFEIETTVGYFGDPEVMDGWVDGDGGSTYELSCTGDPVHEEMVLLLRMGLVVTADTAPVSFYLRLPDGMDHFEYVDDQNGLVLLHRRFGGGWPDAVVNPMGGFPDCIWDPVEAVTWSTLKALYR